MFIFIYFSINKPISDIKQNRYILIYIVDIHVEMIFLAFLPLPLSFLRLFCGPVVMSWLLIRAG